MKKIYAIVDNVANDVVEVFIANNDKHAIYKFRSVARRENIDVEMSLYPVISFNYSELTNNMEVGKNAVKMPVLDHFPLKVSDQQTEEEIKEEIEEVDQ